MITRMSDYSGNSARNDPVRYIALLRGVNVSGHNIIKMAALREILTAGGFADVRTYIQSGNIIFSAPQGNQETLENRISAAIADNFSLEVPVTVLDETRLMSSLKHCPFRDDGFSKPVAVYITFMSGVPDKSGFPSIGDIADESEEWNVKNQIFYLQCPAGYGKTKLSNDHVERILKVRATTRNIRTVKKLAEMAGSGEMRPI